MNEWRVKGGEDDQINSGRAVKGAVLGLGTPAPKKLWTESAGHNSSRSATRTALVKPLYQSQMLPASFIRYILAKMAVTDAELDQECKELEEQELTVTYLDLAIDLN